MLFDRTALWSFGLQMSGHCDVASNVLSFKGLYILDKGT